MAAGDGMPYRGGSPIPMIIALTIIALLIQFAVVYALLIRAQRTQDSQDAVAEPANQRGHQAYYNAFGRQHDRHDERHLAA